MSNSQNQPLTLRTKLLFIIGVVIVAFSCVPFLFGLMNIAPTIEYSQQTGVNYSLNYILPFFVAVVIFVVGFSIVMGAIILRRRRISE
jgi:hypothetical protein